MISLPNIFKYEVLSLILNILAVRSKENEKKADKGEGKDDETLYSVQYI